LIDYLSKKPLPLPKVVDSAIEPSAAEGTLDTNLERAVVFLEDRLGQAYRVSWDGTEDHAARRRSLPAGEYKLRTYRVLRDRGPQAWHTSATAPRIQWVVIKAGEPTQLEINPRVKIRAKLHGSRAQMSITGHEKAGLSVYLDGKRIPIGYRLVSANGDEEASGSMNYG